MTKQEEINWGLHKLIGDWIGDDGTMRLYNFSQAIREYLHSQGVVVKVDCNFQSLDHKGHLGYVKCPCEPLIDTSEERLRDIRDVPEY